MCWWFQRLLVAFRGLLSVCWAPCRACTATTLLLVTSRSHPPILLPCVPLTLSHVTVLPHPPTHPRTHVHVHLNDQLGEAYHSLLDLPCDLNPSNDRTLDEQLQLLHEVISRAFRQSGLAGSYEDEDDAHMQEGGGAWGVGVGEDSGDSGCGGGVGGYGFAGGAGGGGDKDAGGNDVVPEE